MPAFESLLQVGDAVARAGQVGGEHDDDEGLNGTVVESLGHVVPEKGHRHVLLVVARVVGVALRDSASAQQPVEPRLLVRLGHRLHLHAGDRVQVAVLRVPRQRHACREESDVPQKREQHRSS